MSIKRPEVKLSKDNLLALESDCAKMDTVGPQYKGGFEDLHNRYWRLYLAEPETKVKTYPWLNACPWMSPMITVAVDTTNSLYHDAMFGSRPQLAVEADLPDEEKEKIDEFFFDYVFKKEISLGLFGDAWNFNTSIDGTAFATYRWLDDLTVVRSDRVVPKISTKNTPTLINGVSVDVPEITGIESNIVEDVKAERAGKPIPEIIDPARIFVAPGTGRSLNAEGSLQYPNCDWYYIETWKSKEEALQMGMQGWRHLEEDDVKTLLEEKDLTEREREQHRQEDMAEYDPERVLFRIYFMRKVLPGEIEYVDGEKKSQRYDQADGVPEEIIVWRLPKTKKISMVMPLTRMYPDGLRPHVDNHHSPVGNFLFSRGIPALLEQVMMLDTSATRQMVDYGSLVNKPWAFYEPARSGIMPSMQSIAPGALIPTENARGVVIPSFQRNHDFWQLIRRVSQEWQERLTTVTDFVGGRNPALPNSPRTLGGQERMLQQANIAFSHRVALRAVYFEIFMHRIKNLYMRNAPPELEFEVFNKADNYISRRKITREMLRYPVGFHISMNPNRMLQSEKAQQKLALVSNIPMLANDPEAMRNAFQEVYAADGEIDRFNKKIWPKEKIEIQKQQMAQAMQAQPGGMMQQPMGGQVPGQGMMPGVVPPEEPVEEEIEYNEEDLETPGDLAVSIPK